MDRSAVAAGLPVLRAVGIKGTVFPLLKVKVFERGKWHTIGVPDPREAYIKAWNELSRFLCHESG